MTGIPITGFFVWAFLKAMVTGLFAVFVILGVAALVEWMVSTLTSRKESHQNVARGTDRDGELPVVHV